MLHVFRSIGENANQRPEKPALAFPLAECDSGQNMKRSIVGISAAVLCDAMVAHGNICDRTETRTIRKHTRAKKPGQNAEGETVRTRFAWLVPGAVEIHHGCPVMPRNAAGRRTSYINFAREAYRATPLYVDIFRSQDHRLSSCNIHQKARRLDIQQVSQYNYICAN